MDWRRLRLWQIQPIRDLLLIAAVIGILQLGYVLRAVTVPMLLALLFAYLFEPLVRRLHSVSWISRRGAAAIIIASAVVLVGVPLSIGVLFGGVQGLGFVRETAANTVNLVKFVDAVRAKSAETNATSSPPLDSRAEPVPDATEEAAQPAEVARFSLPESDDELQAALESLPPEVRRYYFGLTNDSWRAIAVAVVRYADRRESDYELVRDRLAVYSEQILTTTIGAGTEAVTRLLRGALSLGFLAFSAFLTAFFFYFFSTHYGRVLAFFAQLIHRRQKARTLELIRKMDAVVAGFVRGRLTICLIQCVFFSLGYWLLGVPASMVLGLAVGVLSIVPYMALIGIPISILLLWLDPPGGFRGEWWWIVGAPTVFYFLGQALDDYVWTPIIQGKNTGMDAPAVLFASLAGGILAGVYGLLLAIPVAACLKILLIEVIWPRFKAWTEGKVEDPLPIADANQSRLG